MLLRLTALVALLMGLAYAVHLFLLGLFWPAAASAVGGLITMAILIGLGQIVDTLDDIRASKT